jgi:hypothetical protein
MQVSRTVYRAALLHLSVNPFVRASVPAGTTATWAGNPSTEHPALQHPLPAVHNNLQSIGLRAPNTYNV